MEWIKICNGGQETMEYLAKRGVNGLNRKTRRWQTICKTALYEVRNIRYYTSPDGEEYSMAELWSNVDLGKEAKRQDLVYR